MANYIIKQGQVESIEDELDGGRIKVRLTEDKDKPLSKLPYAFPINPKVFHCTPKVGEAVFVITSELGNSESQRYYLGPIVSQMQENANAPYNYGAGASTSLLQGAIVEPHQPLSEFPSTDGSFPDKTDVAVVGRKSEDIILKDNEIDLRCGIRKTALGDENKNLIGDVLFNGDNPAYIQMKHNGNNLDVKLVHPNSKEGDKTNPLLHDTDMEKLMSQLHQLPYGDILVEILKKMCNAIILHTHAMNGLPPCVGDSVKDVININFNELLSNHVRIS